MTEAAGLGAQGPRDGDDGVIEALAPVAMLIGLGYALRASGFMPEAAWAPIDRLVYFVLFPALLVRELAGAELAGLPVARMAAVLLATQLVMAALAAWSSARRLRLDGPAYTSVLQCVVRWNTYVALALAPAVVAAEGVPLVALAVAVMVPAANVMSVAALARHGTRRPRRAGGLRPCRRDQPTDPRLPARDRAQPVAGSTCHSLVRSRWRSSAGRRWRSACSPSAPGLRPALVADRGRLGGARPRRRISCSGPRSAWRWRMRAGARRNAAGGGGAGLRRADGDLVLHPGPAAGRRRRADGGTGHHHHGGGAGSPCPP